MSDETLNENIEDQLNERQKNFCKFYIFDWNGKKAAIKAGYSEDSAASIASENLTKPNIQAYIEYLKKNLAEVAGISPLMVLQEHQKMAFSSIAHLHLTWIERKEFEALTDDQKACIQEISTKTSIIFDQVEKKPMEVEYVKIKLYDKQKSLDSINKMLGWDAPAKITLDGEVKGQNIIINFTEVLNEDEASEEAVKSI
jgi:phage terminase small subunit